VHEGHQAGLVVEHEDVDHCSASGAPLDLSQRGGDGFPSRGPGEVGESIRGDVRRRLTIGDHHDHRFGVPVFVDVSSGQHQGVLQVRALDPIPVVVDQCSGRHDAGIVAEPDDLDSVLRIFRRDQRV
jgi:hypothetical protein